MSTEASREPLAMRGISMPGLEQAVQRAARYMYCAARAQIAANQMGRDLDNDAAKQVQSRLRQEAVDQLDAAVLITEILDGVVPRPGLMSWHGEIEERANSLAEQDPAHIPHDRSVYC